MRTIQPRPIQHWIAGSETAGASTRWGPLGDDRRVDQVGPGLEPGHR